MNIPEKAFLTSYAREQIGRPRTYHGDGEAHFVQLIEGKDNKVRELNTASEDEPSHDDDSLDSHVSRAQNHLAAMDDEDDDADKMTRLQKARASIDEAMKCFRGGTQTHSIRFSTYRPR